MRLIPPRACVRLSASDSPQADRGMQNVAKEAEELEKWGKSTLRGHGVSNIFIRKLFQRSGFARVVEAENQNSRLQDASRNHLSIVST